MCWNGEKKLKTNEIDGIELFAPWYKIYDFASAGTTFLEMEYLLAYAEEDRGIV